MTELFGRGGIVRTAANGPGESQASFLDLWGCIRFGEFAVWDFLIAWRGHELFWNDLIGVDGFCLGDAGGVSPTAESRRAVQVDHVGQAPTHLRRFHLFEHLGLKAVVDDVWREDDQQLFSLRGHAVKLEQLSQERNVSQNGYAPLQRSIFLGQQTADHHRLSADGADGSFGLNAVDDRRIDWDAIRRDGHRNALDQRPQSLVGSEDRHYNQTVWADPWSDKEIETYLLASNGVDR